MQNYPVCKCASKENFFTKQTESNFVLSLMYNFDISGTRETAFIYAILSAGVVHATTKACSIGNLKDCTCDMSNYGEHDVEGWKWGGCSDNVNYGIWFSETFVDAPERLRHLKSRNIRNVMNLHNNKVGRSVSMIINDKA